jgi:hypothetical protein
MKFLKLSQVMINTSKITSIKLLPSKYIVSLDSTHIHGVVLFGSGSIVTEDGHFTICKEKTPDDYETFTKWIDTIDNGEK